MKIKISSPGKDIERETLLTHCFSGEYVEGYPSIIVESFNDPRLTLPEGLTLSFYMFKYFAEILYDKLMEENIQNLEILDGLTKIRSLLTKLEVAQNMSSTIVN